MHPGRARSFAAAVLAVGALAAAHADGILASKHNLSVGGTGLVRSSSEAEVCIFCHTPHNSSPDAPLWNRNSSGATYVPYSSSTALASPGQPTGDSKLCLSCHDGTVALGMVRSRPAEIAFPASSRLLPAGASRLGTDLSDDHPVSFAFSQALATQRGGLTNPALLTGRVKLDRSGALQCSTCHDPHDNANGKFLVIPNQGAALCTTCHAPSGWTVGVHRTSTAAWNGLAPNPWPQTGRTTVADNSCESCHRPHAAGTAQRLLTFGTSEANCLSCHNGHVARADLSLEFAKVSVHPVAATEVHNPKEDLLNPTRHVECVDCHNPHKANAAAATPPLVSGALQGVRGLSSAGAPLAEVSTEYELCFRCHADSANRGAPLLNRQFVQSNARLAFSASNTSYHPVLAAGKNPDVPSLISPYTISSTMSCTACHNNDGGPGAGGTGPNGPHGSAFRPLLERRLLLTDNSSESAANYALCYKCHSRTSILANTSFRYHSLHISSERTACTTCHDPHGVQTAPHLMNFNKQYVTPTSAGRLEFVDRGRFTGACYLSCHGTNHNGLSY